MADNNQGNSTTGLPNNDVSTQNPSKNDENSINIEKNVKNQGLICKNEQIFNTEFMEYTSLSESESDPVSDYHVILADKNEQNFSMFITEEEDNKLFSRLFPGVKRENVEKDPLFKLFVSGKGKSKPFTALYSDYRVLVEQIGDEIRTKDAITHINKQSSPGSLSSSEAYDDGFFTKDQVLKMSREQIAKNYDKIRKSQQKW